MRYFPLIRSLKAALIITAVMVLQVFMWGLDRLTAVYAIMLAVLTLPALIPVAGLWGGLMPLCACVLSALALAFLPFGAEAALRMALYLLPYTLVYLFVTEKQVPFFRAALMMILALFAGGFLALMSFRQTLGADYCRALAEQFSALIRNSPYGIEILYLLRQMGWAVGDMDPVYMMTARGLSMTLTPKQLDELLLSLTNTIADLLFTMPVMLTRVSIWSSVFGLAGGIYYGRRSIIRNAVWSRRRKEITAEFERRHAQEQQTGQNETDSDARQSFVARMQQTCEEALRGFPDLKMPSFALWHIPRGFGVLAALPALGYLLALMSANEQVSMAGSIMGHIFVCVFSIQGMAAFNYILSRRSMRAGVRLLILAGMWLFINRAFLFIGILDQISNYRRLRPPLSGKEE